MIKNDQLQLPLPLVLESIVDPGAPNPDQVPGELSRNISDPLKLEEEVNVSFKSIDSSSDYLKAEQVGEIPIQDQIERVRKVLAAVGDLFGHKIVCDPRDYLELDRLIAWTAQAFNRRGTGRGKIENPTGLVYWAFHQGRDRLPEKKYLDMDRIERYLPESFMRQSGEWIFKVEDE